MSFKVKFILGTYIALVVIISFVLSYRNDCTLSLCVTGTATSIERAPDDSRTLVVEIDNAKSYRLANSVNSIKSRQYVEHSLDKQVWLQKSIIDEDEYMLQRSKLYYAKFFSLVMMLGIISTVIYAIETESIHKLLKI